MFRVLFVNGNENFVRVQMVFLRTEFVFRKTMKTE